MSLAAGFSMHSPVNVSQYFRGNGHYSLLKKLHSGVSISNSMLRKITMYIGDRHVSNFVLLNWKKEGLIVF